MFIPRRERFVTGRHANVDGIPFRLPVGTRSSPSMMAVYDIDASSAQDMLPGQELFPVLFGSRGLLIIAIVDYRDTAIGRYVEFCIGILCTRGRRPAPPVLPLLLNRSFDLGVYIYDLPVSSEISVKGGLGIWGMPKRQANLDFLIGETTISSQYDLDGELVVRLDVPLPPSTRLPMRFSGVGYGEFRGMLTKSYIRIQGRAGVCLRGRPGARLLLGDHERSTPLKRLDIAPEPLVTAFLPAMAGVLDDHVETWFLTSADPLRAPDVGLPDVADLGLSQEWLAPPDRSRSDRLLEEVSPIRRVGSR